MTNINNYILPVLILIIIGYAFFKKSNIYDYFIEGALEGLKIGIKLFPYLLSMIIAVNIFINSNFLELVYKFISPALDFFHVPSLAFPMFILRPLSSSASLAYITSIFTNFGPDSFIGNLVSTIQGSTDTTIYILTLYFGSIGIKKIKYALKVGLLADIFGIMISILLVNLLF